MRAFFLYGVVLWLFMTLCFASEGADLKDLKGRLRSGDKWIRKSAAIALAKVGSPDAWRLIIPLLGDDAGEVADTAEFVLAGIDDAKTFKLLVGRDGVAAKSEWTRRRAWGVAARANWGLVEKCFSTSTWKRGLRDADVEARVVAVRAAERWAREPAARDSKSWGAVQRGIRSAWTARDERVAVAGLCAGAIVLPSEAKAWCLDAADDRRSGLRAAAARVAPSVLGAEATGLIKRLGCDASERVRAAVLEASDELTLNEAAPLLVGALHADLPLGLRHRAWGKLRTRSGFKHGIASRAWQGWARQPRVAQQSIAPVDDASVSLSDYAPPSDRLVLLLDLSGSVWRKRGDGSCARDDLVRETSAIIGRFDEAVRFDVGVFTARVELHQGQLRAAKRNRIRAATRFLEDATMQGPGDAWSAVETALLDPDVDTVVLLTDGAPTGGQRHRLELLPAVWETVTRARPVALEVLLIGAPPRIHRAWQAIVAMGGGQVRAVELKGL